MRKNIPAWVGTETLINTMSHHIGEAWVESHEHPETGEIVHLALDTSGCDQGVIGVFETSEEAENAVGSQEGFDEFWIKH